MIALSLVVLFQARGNAMKIFDKLTPKKLIIWSIVFLGFFLFCHMAFAGGNELAYKRVNELPELTASSIASGDFLPVWDSSTNKTKKVDATKFAQTPASNLTGRAVITICGDGTTINNNTVYYGPSMVPVASGERTCDITASGNATEATADAPAFDSTAFQVLSMDCLTADPGAAGVSFTLRNNAAATVPSVTCSVANTKLGCTTNTGTTTAIAAGNPIAIAAASTGNQGTTPFSCQIHVAY